MNTLNAIKKIIAIIIYILLAIILIWFTASFIEIACKNLTTQNYSDFNIIIWAINYRP